jgi:hypothetical protein
MGTIQPLPKYEVGGMVAASADWARPTPITEKVIFNLF